MHALLPETALTASTARTFDRQIHATDLAIALRDEASAIEQTIEALLPVPKTADQQLWHAMRYAVLNGGKRLRGFLVVRTAALFSAAPEAARRVAASVEMLHAYSLVHDDLPAMDNDDLRRGLPSCHRRFDEATAILAGDALQSLAFEILLSPQTCDDASVRCALGLALAQASGPSGMVGGQMADMEGEKRVLTESEVLYMQSLKTGRLIQYAAEAGAILGEATAEQRRRIAAYGRDIGSAFQVTDDLLDTLATTAELGKSAGKDVAAGKATLVSLLGERAARARAEELSASAITQLSGFGPSADPLRALAAYVVSRRN